MVIASAAMARKLTAAIPELAVPDEVTRCVDADPSAGVEVAYELIDAIRSSGAFDGVHLIPVGATWRWRHGSSAAAGSHPVPDERPRPHPEGSAPMDGVGFGMEVVPLLAQLDCILAD